MGELLPGWRGVGALERHLHHQRSGQKTGCHRKVAGKSVLIGFLLQAGEGSPGLQLTFRSFTVTSASSCTIGSGFLPIPTSCSWESTRT